MSSRRESVRGILVPPLICFVDLGRRRLRPIEFPDQLCKAVRHALSDHVVVHGAELMPDPGLNLGVKPALLLYFLHGLIHASPRVKSLWFQEVTSKLGLAAALYRSKANANMCGWFRNLGTFSGTFLSPGSNRG